MSDGQDEKLIALRDLILDKAEAEADLIVRRAQEEADSKLREELSRIDQEVELILSEARSRAEEVRRRQIIAAEREVAREKLRLQNRLLSEAKRMLLDELISFRERNDYQLILVGLLLEAEEALPGGGPLKFRLSGADAFMGSEVAKGASRLRPQVVVRFDPDPAPIVGGLWLATEDGRRQVSVDWQTKVNELADVLASRIMPLL